MSPKKMKPKRYKGIPQPVKTAVYMRARGLCELCGGIGDWRGLHFSHIKHRQMGGSKYRDTVENIRLLCADCHVRFDNRVKGE